MTAPGAPVAPVRPCAPTGPVGPSKPRGPAMTAPGAPVAPVRPCSPTGPVGPAGPGRPTQPVRGYSRAVLQPTTISAIPANNHNPRFIFFTSGYVTGNCLVFQVYYPAIYNDRVTPPSGTLSYGASPFSLYVLVEITPVATRLRACPPLKWLTRALTTLARDWGRREDAQGGSIQGRPPTPFGRIASQVELRVVPIGYAKPSPSSPAVRAMRIQPSKRVVEGDARRDLSGDTGGKRPKISENLQQVGWRRRCSAGALGPERIDSRAPAARANGTVRPSDIPMTTSRTVSVPVKWRSVWWV